MDAMAAIAGVIFLTHTYRAWGAGDKWLWDSLSAINKPLAADEWDWSAALRFYFTSLHLLRFGSISSLILFPSGLSWSAILFSYRISLVSHYDIFLFSLTWLVAQSRLIIFTTFIVSLLLFLSLIMLSSFLMSCLNICFFICLLSFSHHGSHHLFLLGSPRLSSPIIFLIILSSFFS